MSVEGTRKNKEGKMDAEEYEAALSENLFQTAQDPRLR